MPRKTALIIGASRGIGLGLARELADRGYKVFASQRTPSAGLAQAASERDGEIEIVEADVTDPASIAALGSAIDEGSLDLLVLNAGVYGGEQQALGDLTRDNVADILMTNTVGPIQAALALLPQVRDGGIVGMVTSRLGSIAESNGGRNLYRMSKVAQNMLSRSLFEDHAKARDIAVLSLHPGWVRTDLGGPNAALGIGESASGLADQLQAEHAPGHVFLAYDGRELSW